ncbi:MAG: DEAD/DEAH box helicase [Thioalkalivibrionaceae bacterium]
MTLPESFLALGVDAELVAALSSVGLDTPTPIQARTIPALIAGRDVLGEARTGTGKTAAYGVPLIERHLLDAHDDSAAGAVRALVLVPTRELALQAAAAFEPWLKASPARGTPIAAVYGGQPFAPQARALRDARLCIGTPGRIADHLRRGTLRLDGLSTIVLDEADEMLRMGFVDEIEAILAQTPSNRQTVLFSATMAESIRSIARKHLRDPLEIRVESGARATTTVEHRAIIIPVAHKTELLTRLLETETERDAVIVFVRTKAQTERLADELVRAGHSAAALSGDLDQNAREAVVQRLHAGHLDVVVATDVAARGLDVARLTHVVHYDIPNDAEAYVHRSGRTGRAGRSGVSILFVEPRQRRRLDVFAQHGGIRANLITPPDRMTVQMARRQRLLGNLVAQLAKVEGARPAAQELLELLNAQHPDRSLEDWFMAALSLAPGALAALHTPSDHRADPLLAPPRTTRRDEAESNKPVRRERPARRSDSSDAFETFTIMVGRNHGASPREIFGALANEGGLSRDVIGRIRIGDQSSELELAASLIAKLTPAQLAKLGTIRVVGQPLRLTRGDGRPEGPPRGRREPTPRNPRHASGKPATTGKPRTTSRKTPRNTAAHARGGDAPPRVFSTRRPH